MRKITANTVNVTIIMFDCSTVAGSKKSCKSECSLLQLFIIHKNSYQGRLVPVVGPY